MMYLPFVAPFSSALHDGEFDCETIKVIFVEVSVTVKVVHVAYEKLDSVIPTIVFSHLKTSG